MTNEQFEIIKLIYGHRKPISTINELLTFRVHICDTNIDCDYERFDKDTIKEMADKFTYKSGKVYGAKGVVFYTEISDNKFIGHFCVLKSEIPLKIQNKLTNPQCFNIGVTIGISVNDVICSICEKNTKVISCNHKKGEIYNNKICYHTLKNITDVYEWETCEMTGD